jgi:hypothetical protein
MSSSPAVKISHLSTEFVRFGVRALENGTGEIDPTGFIVEAAFTDIDVDPVSLDWKPASWEIGGPRYFMRALVGPNGGVITLAEGRYDAHVRIATGVELVVEKAGTLTVT